MVDEDVVDSRLQRHQLAGREHLRGRRRAYAHAARDLDLLGVRRLADHDLHEEAVALRLGQCVDAFRLDRVLRGEHQERVRQLARLARDRHLPLGHHLEQRGLHFGRSPVDLVRKHHVREHGAPLDVERLGRRPPDARADDVGRHEVGRELDAGEAAAAHLRHRRDGERLREPGHPFDQAVPARQEAHERALDHAVLADDHPLDLEQRVLEQRRGLGRQRDVG